MELQKYIEILWRSKWVILATAVVTTVVAIIGSFLVTPRYSATATLRLASAPGGSSDYIYVSTLTRLSNTYVEIATSDITLDDVAERLGLPDRPKVEVELIPETELMRVESSDPDPARARDIANTLANILVEQSQQLYGNSAPTASEILEGQLEQAKIDLDAAMSEYDEALRNAQSSATPAAEGSSVAETNAETLERLMSVRLQIYYDLLQKYESARTSEQLRANALAVVEPAILPEKPSTPNKPLNAALGMIAGLAMGVILAFLFEGMDDTVRGIEDVKEMTPLPILCMIPDFSPNPVLKATPMFSGNGHLSKVPAIDQLRVRLLLSDPKLKTTKILITSPEPGTGKSTVAANLALSLSEAGHTVILVDMDFRRPRQHSILNISNERGLSDYMRGEITLDEAIFTTTHENLRVIVAGSSSHVPAEWLTPDHIRSMLDELSKQCEFILIDAPALLSVADPTVLASQADTVILVVSRRKTERQNLSFALQQLAELNVQVSGVVLNRVPNSQLYSYYSPQHPKKNPIWRRIPIKHKTVATQSKNSDGAED